MFNSSRHIPSPVEQVFAAFSDPARLARWWGPAGFSNTFKTFEFKPGGRWSYVMHGPDGKDYINESSFAEIEAPQRIVIRHFNPDYRLTVTLSPSEGGTLVGWSQHFDSEKVAKAIASIVIAGNEQNLDRLAAELRG